MTESRSASRTKLDGARRTGPQIKICGLTRVDEAIACAEFGADAVGCVFYPPSPRCVSEELARDICASLPERMCGVGVFVNEDFSGIMRKVERCRLKAVQLHGVESAELVARLERAGVITVKTVFMNGLPPLSAASTFPATALLVESAGGALPGGNAIEWNWSAAAGISGNRPFILAGGLNPENVSEAIRDALPDAVDVSSGVEIRPGRKDLEKTRRFIDAVFRSDCSHKPRRIFK